MSPRPVYLALSASITRVNGTLRLTTPAQLILSSARRARNTSSSADPTVVHGKASLSTGANLVARGQVVRSRLRRMRGRELTGHEQTAVGMLAGYASIIATVDHGADGLETTAVGVATFLVLSGLLRFWPKR